MSKLLLKNLLLVLFVFLYSSFGIYYITQDFSDTIIVFILLWAFIYYLIESKVKDLGFVDINLSVKGVAELIANQEKDRLDIEKKGFSLIDTYMTNSAATITCYAYLSKDEDLIFFNLRLNKYHIFEFGSKFEKEIFLTTSNTVTISVRRPEKLIQIFPNADDNNLLEAHRESFKYLLSCGLKPLKIEKENLRQRIIDGIALDKKYQKKIPLYNIAMLFYSPFRYKKIVGKTIEEQDKQDIINIKTLKI